MNALETVRLALLVTHVIGLAVIIGPFVMQLGRTRRFVLAPMLVGAIVQLATGFALVAVRRAEDLAVVGPKIGLKGAIAVVVLITISAAVIWQRRLRASDSDERPLRPLLYVAGLAAIANVVVAVFWR